MRVCLQCKTDISNKSIRNKFCSRSCAASYNNKSRGSQTEETKAKIREALKNFYNDPSNRSKYNHWTEASRAKALKSLVAYFDTREKNTPYELLGESTRKKIILKEQNEKCNRCGLTSWNNMPITLELEHIDGNHDNTLRSNEEMICPNCHSQTKTFRGRNKRKNIGVVTDERLILALKEHSNTRKALQSVNLAPKGKNYARCRKLLNKLSAS